MQSPQKAHSWNQTQSHHAMRWSFNLSKWYPGKEWRYNSVVLQQQIPSYRPRVRTGVVAQILKLLKLVIIQQSRGRGGQIRWNAHSDPTASDVMEMLYGMLRPAPLTLTSQHLPFSAASSSQGWPRPLWASGLASDSWVITIITREALEEAVTWQRPLMFNRIFGCFIDFNSAAGAGERRPGW